MYWTKTQTNFDRHEMFGIHSNVFKKKMENLDFVDHDGNMILTKKQHLF